MEPKKEATIKLFFGVQGRKPNDEEIFNFFKRKGWRAEDLSAMYRENYSVFVRFQSVVLMRKALENLGPQEIFSYADGKTTRVNVSEASGAFKYIRIFGLPPEVEDTDIEEVMGSFGKIHQQVRERFAKETGFPIWNGVRGLLMEVMSEIPAKLRIKHVEARIYYNGLDNKCFKCGVSGHLKADCPRKNESKTKMSMEKAPGSLFSEILKKGTNESSQKELGKIADSEMEPEKIKSVKTAVVGKRKLESKTVAKKSEMEDHEGDTDKFIKQLQLENLIIPPYRGKKSIAKSRSRSRSPRRLMESCTDDEG